MAEITRRDALGFVAGMATLAVVPALAARPFDPAAYVAMWEDCGNIVYWDMDSDCEWFAIYFPDGAQFPEFDAIRQFGATHAVVPDAKRKMIEFLKARGQAAGEPLNI